MRLSERVVLVKWKLKPTILKTQFAYNLFGHCLCLQEMIDEADRDGDGEINEQEFLRIMKKTSLY